MNVTLHIHEETKPTVRLEFSTETDWNPWLKLKVEYHTGVYISSDDLTMHLGGMSIEEGYAFSDSWDDVGHAIREWVNYRSTEVNEDIATEVDA
jgi:hypothetical protein